ncbi:MAG: hypothetical protein AAGE52_30840, partial [Myxococcota bacterium]
MSRSPANEARSACVALPDLPLQLLLRNHPAWRGYPVAVALDESPNAPLTFVNREAKARGLRPGLRHGAARNLVLDLRTGVVSEREVLALRKEIAAALQTFSPRVEPDERFGGVFFVDPNGLSEIYGGLLPWARTVHRYLKGRDFQAAVVVGFHRYRTAVVARATQGPLLLSSPKMEVERSDRALLRDLDLSESLCDPLAMLGVETLGDLLPLPAGELHTRFGSELSKFHGLFVEERQLPMQPLAFEAPRRVVAEFNPPRRDQERLVAAIHPHLERLLTDLQHRGERLTALSLTFHLEPYGDNQKIDMALRTQRERLEPASPTGDPEALLELVRLRLERMTIPAGVERLELEGEAAPIAGTQLLTPDARPKRDRTAASRALARIRASYGERSVTRAALREAHLPEAQFRFVPVKALNPNPKLRKSVQRLPSASPSAFAKGEESSTPASESSSLHHTLLREAGGGASSSSSGRAMPSPRAERGAPEFRSESPRVPPPMTLRGSLRSDALPETAPKGSESPRVPP